MLWKITTERKWSRTIWIYTWTEKNEKGRIYGKKNIFQKTLQNYYMNKEAVLDASRGEVVPKKDIYGDEAMIMKIMHGH